MAFINSNDTSKRYTTKYGEPYLYFSGDVTTLPSNEQSVTASDGVNLDAFGNQVDIGSGKILISAQNDDDGGSMTGSVYIFDLDGSNQIKINASDAAADDKFGSSCSIGQGRIVVGARGNDDGGTNSGSAYIFDLKGTQLTKLTATDQSSGDMFGFACAIGSGRIAVGAPSDERTSPYEHVGSIYLYDLSGTYLRKIIAPNEVPLPETFGRSVSIGSGRIVVGAPHTNSYKGAVFIYDVDGNLINKIATPSSLSGLSNPYFGEIVSVSQGRIVVNAAGTTSNSRSNKIFIYDLDGNPLKEISKTDESNFGFASSTIQSFGKKVAVGSGRIITNVKLTSNESYIIVFDLDGNYIGKVEVSISPAYNLISFIAISNGKIACSNENGVGNTGSSGVVYTFDTPRVYTPYDFRYNEA